MLFLSVLMGLIGGCSIFPMASNYAEDINLNGFRQAAQRARPLIDAIRRFEAEEGHPPGSLAMLVPKYLTVVPQTGIGPFPEFHYKALSQADRAPGKNAWSLSIPAPDFDEFRYFPNENYCDSEGLKKDPNEERCGHIDLVEGWGYYGI